MQASGLLLSFLLVAAFSLTTFLEPWFQGWTGSRTKSANLLTVALGDSRRLFAKHFYVKADAYFHSGYYPSVFDDQSRGDKLHMASEAGAGHENHEEEGNFLGKPKDWLDAFSRHFYPSEHRHLGEEDEHDRHPGEHHDEAKAGKKGAERELLPWLKLAAELDPERPETYIVASYWLRTQLGKFTEAEQFLRQGLQANPENYEILFELGRIYRENRHDASRARNVWELALKHWRKQESGKPQPNIFLEAQILGNLARLEEEQSNFAKAVEYLRALVVISPDKEAIRRWIGDLQKKLTT